MIFPINDGDSAFSFNPNASEFIPSYWKPEVEQPYDGTMMTGGGGNSYGESYDYAQDNMPYVPSSSGAGATPTPLYEEDQETPYYTSSTMPPSGQDAAGNLQTYPNASSNIVPQVQNAITTTITEATEPCKNICCSHKESLANDEAPVAVEPPKKATVPDDDTKKSTEKCEVIPIQVTPVKCFPLYGFIGLHYGYPNPPLPVPQELVKITSPMDNQTRIVVQSDPVVQAPPPSPKSIPKEQASPAVPQFPPMPLPLLPIPQVPAILPDNYQFKTVPPPKNGCNPEQYTCLSPGYVKVDPNILKNLHYRNSALPQQIGK